MTSGSIKPPYANEVLELSEEEARLLHEAGVKVYGDYTPWSSLPAVMSAGSSYIRYMIGLDGTHMLWPEGGDHFFFMLKEGDDIDST